MFFYYAGVIGCTWMAMSVLSSEWVRDAIFSIAVLLLSLAWFATRLFVGTFALCALAMTSLAPLCFGTYWHAPFALALSAYLFVLFGRHMERAAKAIS